jgi:hypothetical protein
VEEFEWLEPLRRCLNNDVDDEQHSSSIEFDVKLEWNRYGTSMLIERTRFENTFWEINFDKNIFYLYVYESNF